MRLREASKILNYDKGKRAVNQKAKLTKEEVDTDSEWKNKVEEPKKSKYLVYLTIGTFLFFVTAIATAYFVRYAGIDRTISTDKVTVTLQGASTIDSGSSVPLTIRVANRNPVSIQNAKLYITYPVGTFIKEEDDRVVSVRRKEIILDEVKTGEIVNDSIVPILYGRSGEKKEIFYELKYSIAGVAQPQEVRSIYEVLMRDTPILLSEPRYTNPIAGKEVTFTFEVQSNAVENIPATYVDVRYPIGFTPNRNGFSINPSNIDGTRWEIIGLKPGTKKTITVTGVIRGQEGESQGVVVRGLVSPTGDQADAVEIASEEEVLAIGQSFLSVDLSLNGKGAEEIVVNPGREVNVVVEWRNQDAAKLNDLILTATISGTGVDETSITVDDDGHFDEVRKQLVWDRDSVGSLGVLGVGETGEVSFRFKTLPDRIEFAQPQKYVRIAVSARARRGKTGAVEDVRDISVAQVKLRSVLQVVENTLYATSALQNSGPLPPQVGLETTFVLKYFIKNSGNEISNFKMAIPLGPRVALTRQVSGVALSEWEYDEENRLVKITIPSLTAKGPQSSRSIELQVSVSPRNEDVGRHLVLARNTHYIARDIFVSEDVKENVGGLTTLITAEDIGDTRAIQYQQEIPVEDFVENKIRAPQM